TAEEHARLRALKVDDGWHVVLEEGLAVAVAVGHDGPQLHAVQHGRVGGGDFGVLDASARGHEVQFTGPHHGVGTSGIAVLDLAGEEPAHGLEPGVRMRRHVHAAGDRDV